MTEPGRWGRNKGVYEKQTKGAISEGSDQESREGKVKGEIQ